MTDAPLFALPDADRVGNSIPLNARMVPMDDAAIGNRVMRSRKRYICAGRVLAEKGVEQCPQDKIKNQTVPAVKSQMFPTTRIVQNRCRLAQCLYRVELR